jgi:hypothetical protein
MVHLAIGAFDVLVVLAYAFAVYRQAGCNCWAPR